MDINLDFDGTVVTHDFPHVGKDIGAVPVLKELVANGHRLILWTMRCDGFVDVFNVKGDDYLTDAIDWFKQNNIPLYGIQSNPEQGSWTSSPKAYAQLIIDDTGLGCPLKINYSMSDRPFVDWIKVREILVLRGLIK